MGHHEPGDPPFWLSRDEVRDLDRWAIDGFGVPGIVLMENAGRGCAELLMRLNPDRLPVTILCGPGNNGGDGFVIARHLDNHGWPVEVFAVEAPGERKPGVVTLGWSFDGLPADALANYRIARSSQLALCPLPRSDSSKGPQNVLTDAMRLKNCWIVDALFGTGLSRGLAGPFDEWIAIINSSGNPVFAVDIPSGLDCDTGEPLGPTIRATHTATFAAHKKGFLNPKSREWTGELHVVDIGAPRRLVDEFRRLRRPG